MRITKRQLRRIISEALPTHLQKHFRKDGSSVHEPEWKDVTPAGYGPDNMPKLKWNLKKWTQNQTKDKIKIKKESNRKPKSTKACSNGYWTVKGMNS